MMTVILQKINHVIDLALIFFTGSLASAIATLGPSLPLYVGEDVSIGIWATVSAQDVKTIDVPCWLPHPTCTEPILESQLTESQMKIHWDFYLQKR